MIRGGVPARWPAVVLAFGLSALWGLSFTLLLVFYSEGGVL